MEDYACSQPRQSDRMKRRAECWKHSDPPNQNLIKRGSRMADYSPYNNRNCGDSPEKSANWKPIGALAADLVRKAVQQQDAAE